MIIKPVRFYCMARHYKKANPVNSIQPPCCPVTEAVFSLRLSPAASVAVIWICPYISRHLLSLTHYWLAAVDIPVASDNPVHYADAIRYNARTPLQGSLLPLTRWFGHDTDVVTLYRFTKLSAMPLLSGLRTAVLFGSSPNIRANCRVSLAR
ncbi:putative prophage side tail fiber protein [Escherichia coli]|uniref:Putative prophage side tail fiber protein n=1 Tax=Escherichia coli TaxID=562 RepID=A0A376ML80_ECOLX|nr:putative prophage side tail fiber protein [Escherichia coli]